MVPIGRRSDRLVLIRLESRGSRLVVVILALAISALAARTIVRPAIAQLLAGQTPGIAGLESALAWNPGDPDLHIRLGGAYNALPAGADYNKARHHFETALRLRPTDGVPWLELALLAEREGDRDRAHRAIDLALAADPHNVGFRWEAALLAYRWGERDAALQHLRYVLAVFPLLRDAAFQLARTLLEPGEDPANLLPTDPDGLTAVLAAAVEHEDVALAEVAWKQRAPLVPPAPERLRRDYLELLLEKGEGLATLSVWPTLVLDGSPNRNGNMVWNGGFETERLLGWGLDWRVKRVWGVEVALDRFVAARGSRSLRLTFNSFPTLNYTGVWQLVPVIPGRQYQLRALAKALDFPTRSGVKIQIANPSTAEVLAETNAVGGTTDGWVSLETSVLIPAGTSLVALRLRREPARLPEGNLGGKVWVDEVSLE